MTPLSLLKSDRFEHATAFSPDELEALINAQLNAEILRLEVNDATLLVLDSKLRGVIVEIVATTLRQVWTCDAMTG